MPNFTMNVSSHGQSGSNADVAEQSLFEPIGDMPANLPVAASIYASVLVG